MHIRDFPIASSFLVLGTAAAGIGNTLCQEERAENYKLLIATIVLVASATLAYIHKKIDENRWVRVVVFTFMVKLGFKYLYFPHLHQVDLNMQVVFYQRKMEALGCNQAGANPDIGECGLLKRHVMKLLTKSDKKS